MKSDQNSSPPEKEASKASFQASEETPLPQVLDQTRPDLHRDHRKVIVDPANTYLRGDQNENKTTNMEKLISQKQVYKTKHIFGNENMEILDETSPDRPRQKRDLPAIYQREQVGFLCLITNHQYCHQYHQYHRHHHHRNDHQ